MECTQSHAPAGHEFSSLPFFTDDSPVFSLYEVRTPWKGSGYLITVARDREHKFLEAMDLGQDMITSRKLFETRDRPFALLMSANQEF